MTSMSEGLWYELAIMLTGSLIWMERHTEKQISIQERNYVPI